MNADDWLRLAVGMAAVVVILQAIRAVFTWIAG